MKSQCRTDRFALIVMIMLAAGMAAGCETTTTRVTLVGSAPGQSVVDPDAMRLQQIAGALLMYFERHHRLPGSLYDLTAVNHLGPPLQFTNPATGRLYVYAPTPIQHDPSHRWLIVYDAAPAHGRRWVILGIPAQARQPVLMYVVAMNESLFQRLKGAAVARSRKVRR